MSDVNHSSQFLHVQSLVSDERYTTGPHIFAEINFGNTRIYGAVKLANYTLLKTPRQLLKLWSTMEYVITFEKKYFITYMFQHDQCAMAIFSATSTNKQPGQKMLSFFC